MAKKAKAKKVKEREDALENYETLKMMLESCKKEQVYILLEDFFPNIPVQNQIEIAKIVVKKYLRKDLTKILFFLMQSSCNIENRPKILKMFILSIPLNQPPTDPEKNRIDLLEKFINNKCNFFELSLLEETRKLFSKKNQLKIWGCVIDENSDTMDDFRGRFFPKKTILPYVQYEKKLLKVAMKLQDEDAQIEIFKKIAQKYLCPLDLSLLKIALTLCSEENQMKIFKIAMDLNSKKLESTPKPNYILNSILETRLSMIKLSMKLSSEKNQEEMFKMAIKLSHKKYVLTTFKIAMGLYTQKKDQIRKIYLAYGL